MSDSSSPGTPPEPTRAPAKCWGEMVLTDSCYGMTGGRRYDCQRCGGYVVTSSPNNHPWRCTFPAPAPLAPSSAPAPAGNFYDATREQSEEERADAHFGLSDHLAAGPTGAAAPTRYVCTRCDWQGEAASLTDAQQRHWEANVECTRAANYSSVEPAAIPAARAPARAGTTEEMEVDNCVAILNAVGYGEAAKRLRAEVTRLSARTGPTADAERYRWLRETFHAAKGGASLTVNGDLAVYLTPEPGKEVRVQWYPDTPVGFHVAEASTMDAAIDDARGASHHDPTDG